MEKITFTVSETEEVEFYIMEETKFHGKNYLLVTESPEEEEEAEVYILKDISKETDTEAIYEMVEDDTEGEAVLAIFSEILEED